MRNLLYSVLFLGLSLFGYESRGQTKYTWNGGAGASSPQWSVANNWTNGVAPSKTAGVIIAFTNTALGLTNVVDDDWTVNTLRYDNNLFGQAHTTIVAAGKTLIVGGGSLLVGDTRSNSLAEIRGGTLQLGTLSGTMDLRVGASAITTVAPGWSNNQLTVLSSVNALNLSNIWVGRQTTTAGHTTYGLLDLSGATIYSGVETNKLKLSGSLTVGGNGGTLGRNPIGILKLPSELTEMDVDFLELANGSSFYIGRATLDFGANSKLTKITARKGCYIGNNGTVDLIGWPSNVTLVVGQPGTPGPMAVGCSQGNVPRVTAALVLTNGAFTAWLTSLKVGCDLYAGGATVTTGVLDLAQTTVCIGGVTNSIVMGDLIVGGDHGRNPYGVLKLPPAVTNLTVGLLEVGASSGTYPGEGLIDFGMDAQLKALTATNGFALGNPGSATLAHFPVGVSVRIGQSDRLVPMTVAQSEGGVAFARFALTNGVFKAWLSSLKVGCNSVTTSGNIGIMEGEVDLASSSVQIGDAIDMVKVHEFRIGGQRSRASKGTLRLPPSVTNITLGILDLGSASNTVLSEGTVDLGVDSQLATLIVSNEFTMGFLGTGRFVGWPTNVNVVVGSPGLPVPMVIGYAPLGANASGSMALTNGSFTAWLSQLKLGVNLGTGGGASVAGTLDLSGTTVRIGDIPNSVVIPDLQVGGGKGRNGNGTLRLPSTVTNFSVGTLEMGAGFVGQWASGLLDFSDNSALKTFAVTNALNVGFNGVGLITNLPVGVNVIIGTPDIHASVVMGSSSNDGSATTFTNGLRLPGNGRFTGYLDTLKLGNCDDGGKQGGGGVGYLELTNGFMDVFSVSNDVRLGNSSRSPNTNGIGILSLPAGAASIGGTLYLGDTHSGSRGILYLGGTRVTVGARLEMSSTGVITNRLAGTAGGIDLQSADTGNLSIASGGKMALLFTADPLTRASAYWGLRMKGNAVAFFQSLTTTPARVTYDISALSPSIGKDFGVYYESRTDTTFLGIPASGGGSLILIR